MSGNTYIEKRNLLKTLPENAIIPVKVKGLENDSSFNELEDGYILLENFPAAQGGLSSVSVTAPITGNGTEEDPLVLSVDETPTEDSDNLVSSGGVFAAIAAGGGDYINRLGTTNLDPSDPASIVLTVGDNVVTVGWLDGQLLLMSQDDVVGSMARIRMNSNGGTSINANNGTYSATYQLEAEQFLIESDNPSFGLNGSGLYSEGTGVFQWMQRYAVQGNLIQRADPAPSSTVVWDGRSDFICIDNATPTASVNFDLVTNAQYTRRLTLIFQSNLTTATVDTTGYTVIGTPTFSGGGEQKILIDVDNLIINFFD